MTGTFDALAGCRDNTTKSVLATSFVSPAVIDDDESTERV